MRLITVLVFMAACSPTGTVILDNDSWDTTPRAPVTVEHVPGAIRPTDAVIPDVEPTDTGDATDLVTTDVEPAPVDSDVDTDTAPVDSPAEPSDVEPAPVDPFEADSDGDGLSDGWETSTNIRYVPADIGPFWRNGTTDPLNPDSDGDGLLDGEEPVDIGDPNSSNPLMVDTDGDNWTDAQERRAGSWPNHADTDGDQVPDGSDPCPTQGIGCPNPVPQCTDRPGLCP